MEEVTACGRALALAAARLSEEARAREAARADAAGVPAAPAGAAAAPRAAAAAPDSEEDWTSGGGGRAAGVEAADMRAPGARAGGDAAAARAELAELAAAVADQRDLLRVLCADVEQARLNSARSPLMHLGADMSAGRPGHRSRHVKCACSVGLRT
jgi:hypothetical protein